MIRDIIFKQKSELEQKLQEKYITRQTNLRGNHSDLVQVIIGPRRAGKSFFGMHHLVETKSFGFVNFDDERLVTVSDFDEILEAVMAVYSNPKVLLLDEIQNLSHWELIVNRLQRQGFQLIITGSNSNLLSSELATHLTGRHLPVYLFTFSFSEYLAASEKTLTEAETKEKFNDFLTNGGYPEPLMKALDYKEYLQVLFDSILFKDIVKRYSIRYPGSLENLAVWLISNISGEFSLNSLAKQTQISSVHTIRKYLNYLEEAFVFFTLSRFSYKIGEQQRSNKKIYCYDNGFFKAKAYQFSEDHGKLLENAIATELMKRSLQDGSKLFYWKNRDQQEVDFVIQQGTQITDLIQVCWSSEQIRTREREIRALLKASRELRCDRLLMITYDEESRESFSWFGFEGEVDFVPARKWLIRK
jgi:predicted AAA+ superfamily ATPase